MITADLLARFALFATLPEDQRALIAARAADLQLQAGEWVIREGDRPSFFGVLAGELEAVKVVGSTPYLAPYGPGEYFGELSLWLGSTAAASLRARAPSRVFRLDPADFYSLVLANPELRADLERAMATQISQLQQCAAETPVAAAPIVGHRWALTCHDLRDFLARNRVAFTWLDPDDPAAAAPLRELRLSTSSYPLLVLPDGD